MLTDNASLVNGFLYVLRRELAVVNQRLTESDADLHVDPKRPNGGAAALRLAFKDGAIPSEVALPVLAPRIEEADNLADLGINAGEICTLVKVAWNTGVRSIIRTIRTVMDLGDDVIKLKRQVVMLLGHLAIFAAMVRASANQICGCSIHVNQEVVFFSLPRILAFRMDRRCPTWT